MESLELKLNITEAVDKAVNCYGTAKILEKRIKCINYINKKLAFIGFLFPSSVGITYAKLGEYKEQLGTVASPELRAIMIAVMIFGIIQMIFSAYSMSHKWNDNLPKYINSKRENNNIADKYHDIWTRYRTDEAKYAEQLKETNKAYEAQQKADEELDITEKERRYGTRSAYIHYKIQCETCGELPIYIKTTSKCPVCGCGKKPQPRSQNG